MGLTRAPFTLSGPNLVWSECDGVEQRHCDAIRRQPNTGDFELYLYDGSEVRQLTDNRGVDDEVPDLAGTRLAWFAGGEPRSMRVPEPGAALAGAVALAALAGLRQARRSRLTRAPAARGRA